jgi:hypothetical protein
VEEPSDFEVGLLAKEAERPVAILAGTPGEEDALLLLHDCSHKVVRRPGLLSTDTGSGSGKLFSFFPEATLQLVKVSPQDGAAGSLERLRSADEVKPQEPFDAVPAEQVIHERTAYVVDRCANMMIPRWSDKLSQIGAVVARWP